MNSLEATIKDVVSEGEGVSLTDETLRQLDMAITEYFRDEGWDPPGRRESVGQRPSGNDD